ncbi:MAG: hypothetical protein E6J05_15915 [Chloroflexi bacterium]|nr:MAG: hypothetical protein E6J05_15915 [Chloroflexota bacterium]
MASFLNGATASLDIAIYDLRLEAGPGATLLGAFQAAVKRGVHVRLMFNQDHPADLPVPPPAEIDWAFGWRTPPGCESTFARVAA